MLLKEAEIFSANELKWAVVWEEEGAGHGGSRAGRALARPVGVGLWLGSCLVVSFLHEGLLPAVPSSRVPCRPAAASVRLRGNCSFGRTRRAVVVWPGPSSPWAASASEGAELAAAAALPSRGLRRLVPAFQGAPGPSHGDPPPAAPLGGCSQAPGARCSRRGRRLCCRRAPKYGARFRGAGRPTIRGICPVLISLCA